MHYVDANSNSAPSSAPMLTVRPQKKGTLRALLSWRKLLAKWMFRLARPWIWKLNVETSRTLGIWALRLGFVPPMVNREWTELSQRLWGLEFLNPVGLAAGYDKDAKGFGCFLDVGFSFVEIGTVTPLPQIGNPPPNFFHLQEDSAVINRQGFPNPGFDAVLAQLRRGRSGVVGVNIGPNRDSSDRILDYVKGVEAFSLLCDYITLNISSPNTVGLRNLQSRLALAELIGRVMEARNKTGSKIPILVKVAPDLDSAELSDVAQVCMKTGASGVIISNTTLSRPHLKSGSANEAGGLSGPPLFELSTRKLAQFYLLTNGSMPLIGVGGIDSAEAAWQKIRAGASLLQVGTAFRFKGPELLSEIELGLHKRLRANGYASIAEAVGTGATEWAEEGPQSKAAADRAA